MFVRLATSHNVILDKQNWIEMFLGNFNNISACCKKNFLAGNVFQFSEMIRKNVRSFSQGLTAKKTRFSRIKFLFRFILDRCNYLFFQKFYFIRTQEKPKSSWLNMETRLCICKRLLRWQHLIKKWLKKKFVINLNVL